MNLKKALLFFLIVPLLFAYSCGGGSSGSGYNPPGTGTGEPSSISLFPTSFIAQTNGCIDVYAEVRDGNGVPLGNVVVTFTNLSEPFARILDKCGGNPVTSGMTNSQGRAKVTVFSTTPGFATLLGQVSVGTTIVRDRKSLFFSTKDVLAVSMDLDVDSVPGNGVFDEISDFTLFETAFDDTVLVRATVRDAGGVRIAGAGVTWASDLTGDNVAFLAGTEHVTDINGEARAVVKIQPASIRNTETHVNIGAFASNGAFNMVTLFLRPVVVSPATSSVTANPSIVDTGGTSDVTAVVFLNTGAPAPDGTIVNFSTAPKTPGTDPSPCGTITPFVPTTGGVTTPPATFTAPLLGGVCTVTGTVEGVIIGSADISVIAPLKVTPSSATLTVGGNQVFTITGGLPPYTVSSSDATVATVTPSTVAASGGTFTVTAVAAGKADITVEDALGTTVKVTITVVTGPDFTLSCTPTTVTSTATSSCTLTAVSGFSNLVTLSCVPPAPTGAGSSCAFAPPSVTPTAGGASTTLTYLCGGTVGSVPFSVSATDGTTTHSFAMSVTCP